MDVNASVTHDPTELCYSLRAQFLCASISGNGLPLHNLPGSYISMLLRDNWTETLRKSFPFNMQNIIMLVFGKGGAPRDYLEMMPLLELECLSWL